MIEFWRFFKWDFFGTSGMFLFLVAEDSFHEYREEEEGVEGGGGIRLVICLTFCVVQSQQSLVKLSSHVSLVNSTIVLEARSSHQSKIFDKKIVVSQQLNGLFSRLFKIPSKPFFSKFCRKSILVLPFDMTASCSKLLAWKIFSLLPQMPTNRILKLSKNGL